MTLCGRRSERSRWLWLPAALCLSSAASACDSVRPDDTIGPGADPIDSVVDCPAEHLVIGLRDPSGASAIARRSAADMTTCRGLAINGQVTAVGGLIDGTELVGVDSRVRRIGLRGEEAWSHEAPSYGLEAAAFAVLGINGGYAVAVLWMTSYSSTGQLVEILDAGTGETMQTYDDPPGSPVAIATGLDGVGDRIALLDQYESLREAQVVIGAPGLGSATEREIQMPRTGGELTWAASIAPQPELGFPGRVAIGSGRGVVYWSTDMAPAALGPVACAWPAYFGETLPTTCEDYDAAVPIPGAEARFVASCVAREESASRPAIVELGRRGDCRVLNAPSAFDANVTVVGMAWAGR